MTNKETLKTLNMLTSEDNTLAKQLLEYYEFACRNGIEYEKSTQLHWQLAIVAHFVCVSPFKIKIHKHFKLEPLGPDLQFNIKLITRNLLELIEIVRQDPPTATT